MQNKISIVCLLLTIGLGLYCRDLSQKLDRLLTATSRLGQDQFLRDCLDGFYSETFIVPPSKGAVIRLVFKTDNGHGEIELLRDAMPSNNEREYILIKQRDPIKSIWRGGFMICSKTGGTVRGFQSITHTNLTTEEMGYMLSMGGSVYRGFGRHRNDTLTMAANRNITYWYEVSEDSQQLPSN